MWEFMKKPKPPKPICPAQPKNQAIKEVEEYRRYVLQSLECYYHKILEELSVTDPESLTKLAAIIKEYETVEQSIGVKLASMEEMINSFIKTFDPAEQFEFTLYHDYDPVTKSLSYRIGKVVKENG